MGRGDEIRQSDLKGQNVKCVQVTRIYVLHSRAAAACVVPRYASFTAEMSPQASHELAGVALGLTLEHSSVACR